ncbi:hypothetical protein ABT008_21250 [Micromonospora sp. NPDC002389]|uniref:hypothetical protein n=1 Tax=Micromonospora sp. NPDC002389 TaxID=3154272 RepID=UPI00332ACCB0
MTATATASASGLASAETIFAARLRAMTVGSVALVSLLAFEAEPGVDGSVRSPRDPSGP